MTGKLANRSTTNASAHKIVRLIISITITLNCCYLVGYILAIVLLFLLMFWITAIFKHTQPPIFYGLIPSDELSN